MEDKGKWYIVNIVSGKDFKAKELLEFELKQLKLDKHVNEIVIPIEKYKVMKNRKTVVKERNMLNGYMLINIKYMHPEIINTVNNTNYIIGFLGLARKSRKNPSPISEREADRLLMRHNVEPVELEFKVGDKVEILGGPFKTFKGEIIIIDQDKNKATVEVKIFGRATKVEMNFDLFKSDY